MANDTGSYGLKPVRHQDGSPWNGATVRCYISASYATALFVGDPVLLSPTSAEKDATAKHPTINVSDGLAGSLIRGVITSFEPDPDNLTRLHSPASTEGWANVSMGGDVVYQIRGDGTALTSVVPGQNAVMIATSAGSTASGLSGFDMDEGTTTAPNTTQNFTLHVIALTNREDNDLLASAEYEVLLNTQENATGRFLGVTAA